MAFNKACMTFMSIKSYVVNSRRDEKRREEGKWKRITKDKEVCLYE